MSKYNPKEFIDALRKKVNGRDVPNCPYCGGDKFTTTDKFATLIIGNDVKSFELGPSIPSGMIICENCGHVEFFALGSLGLLKKEGESGNGN